MGDYAKFLREDRRLTILRVLCDAQGNTANHYVLQTILNTLGHSVSRDVVRGDLAWLAEQGLVNAAEITAAGASVTVAALTPRGDDVAAGRAVVPGVKRPVPGEA